MIGLIDTSVFVGIEAARLNLSVLPAQVAVSVVTLAELRLAVLLASDVSTRQRRLSTLQLASSLDPMPIDVGVAEEWARVIAELRQMGRRAPVNDIWVAATAIRNSIAVITQDSDFDAISGLELVRI